MADTAQEWIAQLKVALIEKNTTLLATLAEEIPSFNSAKELETAQFLSQEAVLLLQTLKEEAAVSMQQVHKSLQFLHATERPKMRRLDIIS